MSKVGSSSSSSRSSRSTSTSRTSSSARSSRSARQAPSKDTVKTGKARSISKGMAGQSVRGVQDALNKSGLTGQLTVDGKFGPKTDRAVRQFQARSGLAVDGKVGPKTLAALDKHGASNAVMDRIQNAHNMFGGAPKAAPAKDTLKPAGPGLSTGLSNVKDAATLGRGAKGANVEALQDALNKKGAGLRKDGDYGPRTARAVSAFQKANGLPQTGTADARTMAALNKLDSKRVPEKSLGKLPGGIRAKNKGVNLRNLDPRLQNAMDTIVDTYRAFDPQFNGKDVVITSGNDGRHSRGSLHYSNKAIDLRSNILSNKDQHALADRLQRALGSNYEVISETYRNHPANDHIHIELDRGGARARRLAR